MKLGSTVNDATRFLVAGASWLSMPWRSSSFQQYNSRASYKPHTTTQPRVSCLQCRHHSAATRVSDALFNAPGYEATDDHIRAVSCKCENSVTCILAILKLLEAPGRVQALHTVLLRLATTTTEVLKLALDCHVFLVGLAFGVSMHMRTRYVRAHATYGAFYRERPAKLSAQEDEWTAIVVLCTEYGRWPTVIMHTGLSTEFGGDRTLGSRDTARNANTLRKLTFQVITMF